MIKQNWQILLIITSSLLGFAVSVYFWYPGSLSVDSFAQMAQAETGNYRDSHPTIMAFLWRTLNAFSSPPQNLFIFYITLLWAALCGIAVSLRSSIGIVGALLITLIGVFPAVFGISGVLWKDIGLGVSLLASIHYMLRLKERFSWWDISFFLIAITYAVNIRHNAYFSVLPFLALTLSYLPQHFKITKARLIVIAILAPLLLKASYSAFESVVLKPYNDHFIQHLQFADLNGLSSRLNKNLVNEEMKLKPYTVEEMSKIYYKDHRCSDEMNYGGYLRIVQDPEVRSEIFKNWISVISDHPTEYLKHRWRYFKGQLGIGHGPCRSYHFYFDKKFDLPSESRANFRDWVGRKFGWMDFRTPFFTQWFYLALSFGLLLLTPLVLSGLQLIYFGTLVSGIAYYLPYFFISLCCDFRYVWWTVLASLLGFSILVGSLSRRLKTKLLHSLTVILLVTGTTLSASARTYFSDSNSDTYSEAKDKFLMACSTLEKAYFEDFTLYEDYSVDTCRRVFYDSKTLIILSSGLHGIEGFIGSAIQLKFMNSISKDTDIKFDALIIHGLNPWGFQNLRRTTENNVDLNRNFALDEDLFRKKRPTYISLNDFLNPEEKASTGFFSKLSFLFKSAVKIVTHGMKSLRQAVLEGQYEIKKGIFFGGKDYEPHVQVVRDILRLVDVEKYNTILIFDLHSGYGERGQIHLFPDKPSSEIEKQKLIAFFDDFELDFGTDRDFYEVTGEFATYVAERLKRLAPSVSIYPMVLEVGTMDSQTTLGSVESLRRMVTENQGYYHGYGSAEDRKTVTRDFLEMFNPKDKDFRESILNESLRVIEVSLKRASHAKN